MTAFAVGNFRKGETSIAVSKQLIAGIASVRFRRENAVERAVGRKARTIRDAAQGITGFRIPFPMPTTGPISSIKRKSFSIGSDTQT